MTVRHVAPLVFTVLFSYAYFDKEVWGDERDEIKKEMQEIREQMGVMKERLDTLEERNRVLEENNKMLEEEAQRQKEEKEIEEAITETAPRSGVVGSLQRIVQTLNPDISVIGIFTPAYFSEDEPFGLAENDPENTGVNLQEIEVAFQGAIDPYFRFDSFFSIGREGIETEEAFATTLLSLPLNSQARVGVMRSKFGRINLQHRHNQDFVTLPIPAARFLGEHLNPTGIELNFLLPLPWFSELSGSVNSPEVETATFDRDEDANNLGRLLYIVHLSNFFEVSDDLSLNLGGSVATGSNGTDRGNRSNLYGADLFVKYRPLVNNQYQEFWLQSEFIYRQAETLDRDLDDWGAYAQGVYRFAKRWNTGVRFDFVDTDDPIPLVDDAGLIGIANEEEEEESLGLFGKELRYALMLTFNPTEFSRVRLQYEFADPDFADNLHALFLQFQYSLGAHGAHPF